VGLVAGGAEGGAVTNLRLSPGTVDSVAKGWIVTIRGDRCRILGRADPRRWRVERIDRPTRETFTIAVGAVEMESVERSLRGRGMLG